MFGSLGPAEMLFVGMIALLLFGKKLPDVALSVGKSFREFKRGLSGIPDDLTSGPTAHVQDCSEG